MLSSVNIIVYSPISTKMRFYPRVILNNNNNTLQDVREQILTAVLWGSVVSSLLIMFIIIIMNMDIFAILTVTFAISNRHNYQTFYDKN